MKKFLTIVCTLAILTSLASCGENQEDNNSIATEVSTETEIETEKEEEITTQEEATEPITEQITVEETTISENETEPPTEKVAEAETIMLYEENGLKIFYKGLTFDDLFGDISVNLYIENNCNQDITIHCRDFCINDFVTDCAFSCDIANGKKANDKISVWKSDLEANNLTIDNIEKIEFSFHVINEESWDTIFDSPIITINTSQADVNETVLENTNESQAEMTIETEEAIADEKVITATGIIQYFIDNNAPNLGEYVERTESDDNLLGRPEQYISKVSFRITTVELDEEDPYDASIEVFNNADDALKRYNEVSSLIEQFPMFKEYLYLKDNILLRMKFDVLPSDEQVYEQLLNDCMNT